MNERARRIAEGVPAEPVESSTFETVAPPSSPELEPEPAPEPDLEPPSQPGSLSSPAQTVATVDLTWDASTDNVAVVSYNIYREGVVVASSPSGAISAVGMSVGYWPSLRNPRATASRYLLLRAGSSSLTMAASAR